MITRAAIVLGFVLSGAPVAAQETPSPETRQIERLKSALESCTREYHRSLRHVGNPARHDIAREMQLASRQLARCRSRARRTFEPPRQRAAQDQLAVHVVRHFDTPKGEKDPDLLPQGAARAEALARWFRGKGLCAILVTQYQRTRQTVAPLAASRGIALQSYDAADTAGAVARAKASPCPVLIVGHSNTVPDIVVQLGGARPADLKHEDFGDVWTVADGKTERIVVTP